MQTRGGRGQCGRNEGARALVWSGLTCSVVFWGWRNPANKYHWCVSGVLAVYGPHWVCPISRHVLSGSTLLRLQGALRGTVQSGPWGFMHFSGPSHLGSGSQVLHKGTNSVGHAFCALPRSEQLRRSGARGAHCPSWAMHLNHLSGLGCVICLLWEADLKL